VGYNGAFAMRLAGARVREALSSTVTVSLASIESGSPENSDIGGIVVSSDIPNYRLVLTNDGGGQVKIVNDRIVAGATPTNYSVSPSFTIGGALIFENTERVFWTAVVTVLPAIVTQPTASIYPSAAWSGVAGSGFTAANGYPSGPPADPTRNTAKPGVAILFSERPTAFSEDYPVPVRALAGGLSGAFGIQKVIFHLEGNRFEVADETVQSVVDPRGRANWRVVAHHAAISHALCVTSANPSGNGEMRLYVETVPNDTTMQRRVMGPFTLYRRTTPYDYDLSVAPSQTEVAGSRYQSLGAALNFLANTPTAHNNRITAVEDMAFGDLQRSGTLVTGRKGKVRIQAAAGKTLTIARPDTSPTTPLQNMNPLYDGLELYRDTTTGELVVDQRGFLGVVVSSGVRIECHGIRVTNSLGPAPLAKGGKPGLPLGAPQFRYCLVENQGSGPQFCVAFYSEFTATSDDFWTNAPRTIGNRVYGNTTFPYSEVLGGMAFRYTEPGTASATLNSSHVFTLNDPAGSVSITFGNACNAPYYYLSQVAAWVSSRANWTGYTFDTPGKPQSGDARSARSASPASGTTSYAPNVEVYLLTRINPHNDFRQIENLANSNVVSADNHCWNNSWQTWQIARTTGIEDIFFANETHYRNNDVTNYGANVGRNLNNVNWFHISHQNAPFRWVTDNPSTGNPPGLFPDAYSSIRNSVFEGMNWSNGGTHRLPAMIGNHIIGGRLDIDTTSTSGSSTAALFVSAVTGDFTPQGALLSDKVTPVCKYDAYGTLRATTDAKGAVAIPT
jgi:hypothetical protein